MRPMTDPEIKAKGLEILVDVNAFCRRHDIERQKTQHPSTIYWQKGCEPSPSSPPRNARPEKERS